MEEEDAVLLVRAAIQASGTDVRETALSYGLNTTLGKAIAVLEPEYLAFSPGLRTTDRGQLGETSGVIEVSASGRQSVSQLVWTLTAPNGREISRSKPLSASSAVSVHAGVGGKYIVSYYSAADTDLKTPLGRVQVSVPQFIAVAAPINGAMSIRFGGTGHLQ